MDVVVVVVIGVVVDDGGGGVRDYNDYPVEHPHKKIRINRII